MFVVHSTPGRSRFSSDESRGDAWTESTVNSSRFRPRRRFASVFRRRDLGHVVRVRSSCPVFFYRQVSHFSSRSAALCRHASSTRSR